jgi:hypothetical protein
VLDERCNQVAEERSAVSRVSAQVSVLRKTSSHSCGARWCLLSGLSDGLSFRDISRSCQSRTFGIESCKIYQIVNSRCMVSKPLSAPRHRCPTQAKLRPRQSPRQSRFGTSRPDNDQPHVNANNSNILKQGLTVLAAEPNYNGLHIWPRTCTLARYRGDPPEE